MTKKIHRPLGLMMIIAGGLLLASCALTEFEPLDIPPAPTQSAEEGLTEYTALWSYGAYDVADQDYRFFQADAPPAPAVSIRAGGSPTWVWQWTGEWTLLGQAHPDAWDAMRTRADDGPLYLATWSEGPDSVVEVSFDEQYLVVDRLFQGWDGEATLAPTSPTGGSTLQALVVGVGMPEGFLAEVQPEVFLADTATEDPDAMRPLEAWIEGATGLPLGDDEVVISFALPELAPLGEQVLRIQLGELDSGWTDVTVACSSAAATRLELGAAVDDFLTELHGEPLALVAPYQPLPEGALLRNAFSDEIVADIAGPHTWLFFGYDPASGFEQPEATWVLVDDTTWEWQVLYDEDTFPEVVDGDGNLMTFDIGLHANLANQFYGLGSVLTRLPMVPGPVANAAANGKVAATRGMAFSDAAKAKGCKKVLKLGVIVTLDDDTRKVNFSQVHQTQKTLMTAMGFDRIGEVEPDELLVHRSGSGLPEFKISTDNPGTKSLREIKVEVGKLLDLVDDDCCAEMTIFVNAHGSTSGSLKYRNRDAPYDEAHKDHKPRPLVKGGVDSSLVAKLVAQTFAEKGKTCVPLTLIFHTCYAGAIANDSDYLKAVDAHPGMKIVVSSKSTQTTKGNGGGTCRQKYFFLEAMRKCMLITDSKGRVTGMRTIQEAWECIVEETMKQSGSTQKPQIKP